jgi:putative hydrolase of HD superfamily
MTTAQKIIQLTRYGETLKRVMRTGWSLAGVNRARPESVGEHSYGTALLALLIAKELIADEKRIDLGKVTSMALFHDLPEALTSDIPQTAAQLGGEPLSDGKRIAEKEAILLIAGIKSEFKTWMEGLWAEQEHQTSLESKIVSSADTLDMLIHALALEESGVSPNTLDQFFTSGHKRLTQLDISIAINIFWELYEEHLEYAERGGIALTRLART